MRTTNGFEVRAGQSAIVTGAASGIGLELARALAARGVNLAIADLDETALEAARCELAASGVRVVSRVIDVADEEQIREAARAFGASLGHVHLLFNNAGIEMSGSVVRLVTANWRKVFDVNVFGIVHGLQHFLPLLEAHGEAAHVVNTASCAGFWTNPNLSMGAYGATKYAAVAISEALEVEMRGSPIGVSVLCPGAVATAIAERSTHASPQLRAELVRGTSPELAARLTIEGIARGDFFIFTPNRIEEPVSARHERILEALHRVPASTDAH